MSVTASAHAHAATASVVDFDPRHEIILLCGVAAGGDSAALAETLLALGFDAFVLCGTPTELAAGLQTHGQPGRPALLVGSDEYIDTPVLRSRVARMLSRPYCWLEGAKRAGTSELQRRICARMDAFERDHSADEIERVEVEEVSNLVLLPVVSKSLPPTPTPTPTPPAPPLATKLSRVQLVVWPMVGAVLTALGIAAMGAPTDAPPPPPPPSSLQRAPSAVAAEPAPVAVAPTPAPAPIATASTRLPPAPPPATPAEPPASPPSPPAAAGEVPTGPLGSVVENERVTATDTWLVYEAPERARDWYAAMDLCRGRTLAGVGGWSTPSSKQLHALAKAHALPEGALWSRTRPMSSEDAAFVIHGRAGTIRRAFKTETLDTAVCVRARASRD